MDKFIKGVGAVACGVIFGWAIIKGIDKATEYAEKKYEKAAPDVDEDGTVNVDAEEVKTEEV